MCIALLTTLHPLYPLIILSNRDEYLSRPTAPAQWWTSIPSNKSTPQILGGRDLHSPAQGSWLALSRSGRLAILTNFRDQNSVNAEDPEKKSRGALVGDWVSGSVGAEEFAREAREEFGGFTLVFGNVGGLVSGREEGGDALAVVSNRNGQGRFKKVLTRGEEGVRTVGVSNGAFGEEEGWAKVRVGKKAVEEVVRRDAGGEVSAEGAAEAKQSLLEELFNILSQVDFPDECQGSWETALVQMRESIRIPRLDAGAAGFYGTQKQTVMLVDRERRVTFVERTLFDERGEPVEKGCEERRFEFEIEGDG